MSTGIIQFSCHHREGGFDCGPELWDRFLRARQCCREWGIVGYDPARYMGYAFGNLSLRWPCGPENAFLITGSGTSGLATLTPNDCALCERCDLEHHALWSVGHTKPSSESLSHAPFYRRKPRVQAVIHGHCGVVWRHARDLDLPCTPASATCGTPELSHALDLSAQEIPGDSGMVAMLGHEDGILTFGPSIEDALQLTGEMIARAERLDRG